MEALLLNTCLLLALFSPVASLYCDTCMAMGKECPPDATTIEMCPNDDDVCVAGQANVALLGAHEEGSGNDNGEDYENNNNPLGQGYGYDSGYRINVHRREYGGDYGNAYEDRNNERRREHGGDNGNEYGKGYDSYGNEYGNDNGNDNGNDSGNSTLITTYKGCMRREKCQAGLFSILTEDNRVIQYVRKCCDSNNCNRESVQMEMPSKLDHNGLMCPSCYSRDLSDCNTDKYIQCSGRMTQCIHFMATTTTMGLFSIDTSLRGCASESVCLSPVGKTEIGGHILVNDIYTLLCSPPLQNGEGTGSGSSSPSGRSSSYGDYGSTTYEPGRSSSYDNDGSSSYGNGGTGGGSSFGGDRSSSNGDYGSTTYEPGRSSSYDNDGSSSYGNGGTGGGSSFGGGRSSSYGDYGSTTYEPGRSSSYDNDGSSSYGNGGTGGGSSFGGDRSSSYGNDRRSSNENGRSSSYEDNGGFSNEGDRASPNGPDAMESM